MVAMVFFRSVSPVVGVVFRECSITLFTKGLVYLLMVKNECAECPATYIGETGRTLDCRIKEHKRSTEKQDVANRIAIHHMETNHRID
jgi:hypothetical protein